MTYSIKLTKEDTNCLRQTVAEAFRNGQEQSLGDDTTKRGCSEYHARLLAQIEQQAQSIAEEAFEAGRNAPAIG
jgi:hypothetical protein